MKNESPEFIYKYTSINKYLYEVLIRNELWFSAPYDFNDPFDSSVPIDLAIESLKKISISISDWSEINKLVDDKNINEEILAPSIFSKKLKELRKQFGVCCFSSIDDNLIMWSHYADNHKGILLKFDTAELNKAFERISLVTYTDKLEEINYKATDTETLFTDLLTKKSTHWESENEVRIITKKNGHFGFPKSSLREIKFGLRCDLSQMHDIINLCEKFGYRNTVFSQSQNKNYEYKLISSSLTESNEYKAYKSFGDKGNLEDFACEPDNTEMRERRKIFEQIKKLE